MLMKKFLRETPYTYTLPILLLGTPTPLLYSLTGKWVPPSLAMRYNFEITIPR